MPEAIVWRLPGTREVLATGNHAYIDQAGQLRDIFAAIYPDLGNLQLATLYDAFKRSYEENAWDREGTRGTTPRFSEFFKILQSTSRPDKGTRTLLNRLTELADRGFFDANTLSPGYLDTSHPTRAAARVPREDFNESKN